MTDQLTLHRQAYQTITSVMPGAEHVSHTDTKNSDWQQADILMPRNPNRCPTCGFDLSGPGFTHRCRSNHDK